MCAWSPNCENGPLGLTLILIPLAPGSKEFLGREQEPRSGRSPEAKDRALTHRASGKTGSSPPRMLKKVDQTLEKRLTSFPRRYILSAISVCLDLAIGPCLALSKHASRGKPLNMTTILRHNLMDPRPPIRAWLPTALGLCALLVTGCAGIPRIDPTGERIFIWPKNQVSAPGPTTLGPTTTNVQAPPVFTDRVFPQPSLPTGQVPQGLVPPVPQDRLTITPDRVLAPVGSEVILKAGLCTRENYLLTDSKIEWLIARDEVGEIVALGGRGWKRNPLLPWNKSKKIDNQYATGYTARVPLRITRGTSDPSDDVQVEPGEAWASVTSPVEGTTRITAVAPEIESWANRRATATIYWVDVQWTFPPPTVSAGGSQVLTTTVRRHTDGTPIEGWLVRYEVTDGTGALRGSKTGQVVEVPTDAQGRASIDVTPTGSAGTTTRIATQIVRPVRFRDSNAPRLVIANGASTIHWTDGGSDYLPPPDNLGSPLPTVPLPGQGSQAPIVPAPLTRRGPKLELEIYPNDTQIQVGQQARFEVLIRNTGDATATDLELRDRFDQGLAYPGDPEGFQEIKKSLKDITAGESHSEFLDFDVRQAGQLCQNFTLTYSGGSAQERFCIEALQPVQQPQGRLQVTTHSPRQRNVGEIAQFQIRIKNIGEGPLTNIEIVDTFDRELAPQPTPGAEIRKGSLFWKFARLDVGETKQLAVNCECLAAKLEACSIVLVSADTGAGVISQPKQSCTEIRPRLEGGMPNSRPAPEIDVLPGITPGITPGVMPPTEGANVIPNANDGLRMEIISYSNSVRAGTRMTFQIVINNGAATSDRQVQLHVLFPPELTPDETAIRNEANVSAKFNQGKLVFGPIQEIRPGERLEFLIPTNVNQQGMRNVTAVLVSQNMPQELRQTKSVEILGR